MAMKLPKALVWQRVRSLHMTLSASEPAQADNDPVASHFL